MTERTYRVICRATRAERYDCGHVLMGDRLFDPRIDRAQVVSLDGLCAACRKLAEWKRLSGATS